MVSSAQAGSPHPSVIETVIEPGNLRLTTFSDLWQARNLLYFLIWRDLKIQYKQTLLGILWAVIRPLLNVGLFTIIFGIIIRVPSEGAPFYIFVYTAMLGWTYFSTAVNNISSSLVQNRALLTKVYFPRIVLPLAAAATP